MSPAIQQIWVRIVRTTVLFALMCLIHNTIIRLFKINKENDFA